MTQTETEAEKNALSSYALTLLELCIVALALFYAFTSNYWAMLLWTVLSLSYLVVGFFVVRHRSLSPASSGAGRVGVLGTLSWVLPFAASVSGVNTAIIVLLSRSATEVAADDRVLIAILGSAGIVISWLMLQVGFAHVYQSSNGRIPGSPGLVFPNAESPRFVEYLYFAFVIGTSFATSDTAVCTSRMRTTVTVHAIVSFFYNAMVVAIAFQVLQQIAAL